MQGELTRLCVIGDSSSVHVQRWVQHFSKGFEVIVVSTSCVPVPGVRTEPIFATGSKLRKLVRVLQLRKLVKQFSPDIVHGHYLTLGGFYSSLSGGRHIVGSAWGSDIYSDPQRSFTERRILKFVLRRYELVFAGSKDAESKLRELGYKGPVAIVRFGVDANMFRRTSAHGQKEFRIFHLRHCSEVYNPLVILEGFRRALPSMPDAYLYMLESGNQIAQMHQRVESDPELKAHVRFINWVPYDKVPALYNSMDMAISLPTTDSVAASVLESMASELPLIVSDIPNMRELIEDGLTGYLSRIDPGDVATKLREAFANRVGLGEMGKRERDRVLDPSRQATWEANMKVAEEAYASLLQGGDRG